MFDALLTTQTRSRIFWAISAAIVAAHNPVALAESGSAAGSEASSQPTQTQSGGATDGLSQPDRSQAPPIKGGVQKVVLNLERLRDIGLDLKHVLSASNHLFDEVTIQPVTMVTEPEIVGFGTVINIPIATQPVGPPLPPRKDRLDLAMNQMKPIVTMFKQRCDDFVAGRAELDLPQDVMAKLEPSFAQWVDLVNDVNSQLVGLEPLTQGPTYDNQAIADAANAIQKDVKKLEKTRKTIYKVIQKEGKRKSSAAA